MKHKICRPENFVVGLAAIILMLLLLIKPLIGVADNGELYRIMEETGLEYLTDDPGEKYFGYMHGTYRVTNPEMSEMKMNISTQVIAVKAALLLNNLIMHNGLFDIRFLSIVYVLVLLSALFLIAKYCNSGFESVNWLLAGLLVFIFADVGYISYFNSLYGEAPAYTSLLLTIGMAVVISKSQKPSIIALVVFFLSALLFIGSQQQSILLILLLAFLGARMCWFRKDKLWRISAVILLMVFIATAGFFHRDISREIRNINIYNAVFFGVLKDSPEPRQDLLELGLSTELSSLAGRTYYDQEVPIKPDSPEMQELFFDRMNYSKIVTFYMKHPLRFVKKLEITANNAFTIRQGYLGNYEKAEGVEAGKQTNAFGLWSFLKRTRLPNKLWFVMAFFIAFISTAAFTYKKSRDNSTRLFIEVLLFILIIGIQQFFSTVVLYGEADLSKKLFLFNVCFDLLFTASVVWGAYTALFRRQRLEKLYGIKKTHIS